MSKIRERYNMDSMAVKREKREANEVEQKLIKKKVKGVG